jgi:integrase
MRVRDLWFTTGTRGPKRKTARHPDRGGDRDSKRWLVVWQDGSGRERTKAFAVKQRAADYGARMEADASRGEYIDPSAGQVLVGALAAKWLRLREVSAGSAKRYESAYRIHIAPVFGERQAGSVRPSEVAEWSRGLAAQPSTRHMALTILTGVFDLAVADKARKDNPVRSGVVTRPKRTRSVRADPWDAARVLAVAEACGAYRVVPLVAAGLGLRQGECFGLGFDDFDFEAGVVNVRRQLAQFGSQWVFKLPKGGKERVVPLPRGVAALVTASSKTPADLRESRPDMSAVTLPWLNEDGSISQRLISVPLLFTEDGEHLRFRAWNRNVWKPALEAVGLLPPGSRRSLPAARQHGMHSLRHWYSTHLLDNGVSLAACMEFLGHSRESAPLAIGVYGHVTPEAFDRARVAVDTALFKPRLVASDGTRTEQRRAK